MATTPRPRQGLLWKLIVRLPVPVRLFLWKLVLAVLPERVRARMRERLAQGRQANISLALDPTVLGDRTPPGRPDVFLVSREADATSPLAELGTRLRAEGHRVFRVAVDGDADAEVGDVVISGDPVDSEERLVRFAREHGIRDAVAIVGDALSRDAATPAITHTGWKLVDVSGGQAVPNRVADLYPRVSIVILTFNKLEYTRLCLDSVVAMTTYPNYEIVVVDNQSTDETPDFLTRYAAEHDNVRAILNPSNQGFAGGNNTGARAATGDYLVFLNNDTVVTSSWLTRLVRHLDDQAVGMVSPVTNWAANASKIDTSYGTLADMEGFAEAYTAERFGRAFETDVLNFFCVALRRGVYDQVGPLDERYGTGLFEDDDYSRRVRAAGYRLLCAEDAFVHHWGNVSFSQLEGKAYLGLIERNRRLYEDKWKTRWTAPTRR